MPSTIVLSTYVSAGLVLERSAHAPKLPQVPPVIVASRRWYVARDWSTSEPPALSASGVGVRSLRVSVTLGLGPGIYPPVYVREPPDGGVPSAVTVYELVTGPLLLRSHPDTVCNPSDVEPTPHVHV